MKKIYYLLLFLILIFGLAVVFILSTRAYQADQFFEYQRQQEAQDYEPK